MAFLLTFLTFLFVIRYSETEFITYSVSTLLICLFICLFLYKAYEVFVDANRSKWALLIILRNAGHRFRAFFVGCARSYTEVILRQSFSI